jgi:hypothetical protein
VGFGPILPAATASDAILGTGTVLLGPEAVIIYTPGHWVLGALVSNSWSVAGDPLPNRPTARAELRFCSIRGLARRVPFQARGRFGPITERDLAWA